MQDNSKSFENSSGRKTNLEIASKHEIGEGAFGQVYETEIKVGDHNKTLVLKKFKGPRAKENAVRAFENHALAKSAGLKVFPTYRLNSEDNEILMTLGNDEYYFCVDSKRHTPNLEKFGGMKMTHIDNFDEVVNQLFAEAVKAAKSDIAVPNDAPFYLVDRKTQSRVGFLIGDVDSVTTSDEDQKTQTEINLHDAYISFTGFLLKSLTDPKPYFNRLEILYNKARTENNL